MGWLAGLAQGLKSRVMNTGADRGTWSCSGGPTIPPPDHCTVVVLLEVSVTTVPAAKAAVWGVGQLLLPLVHEIPAGFEVTLRLLAWFKMVSVRVGRKVALMLRAALMMTWQVSGVGFVVQFAQTVT